jgi:hypothetical protein
MTYVNMEGFVPITHNSSYFNRSHPMQILVEVHLKPRIR